MSHSSGKERKAVYTEERKTSGKHMMPPLESKFPGHQAYRMND